MSIVAELKRRKVFQVGAAYLVVAWVAVQAASIGFPAFEAPPWALRVFILVAFLGFPVALVMAWVFQATADGVRFEAGGAGSKRMFAVAALLSVFSLGWFFYGQPALRKADVAAPAALPQPSPKSIAVLPFTDLSPGHDQEYFSDGMSEEILNALAKIRDLKVAGRTSSFYYKGRSEDLRGIGKALGVANVLEGSVRKQGDKVRITAQLIRTDDGFHLWSDSYDGELTDIFELQERIARAITGKLQVILQGDQQQRLVPVATTSPEAYALYLQASGTFNRRDGARMPEAIAQIDDAIRLDPSFARAYSRGAALHAVSPSYAMAPLEPAYEQAERQLQVAMKLDPSLAEPHGVLGYIRSEQRRHAEAEQSLRRALELEPDDVQVNFWYAITQIRVGYVKQGIAVLDRLLAMDPMLPNGLNWRGLEYVYAGDLASGERLLRRAQEVGLTSIGWSMTALEDARGHKPEAQKYMAGMLRLFMGTDFPADAPETVAAGVFGDAGARARSLELIERYVASKPNRLNGTVPYALIRLGEPARGLALAQDQLTGNDGFWMVLIWSPYGKQARGAPEFQTFIRRMGLTEFWQANGDPDFCRKDGKGGYACD